MTRSAEIAKAREVDTRIAAEWDAYYTARTEADQHQSNIEKNQKYIAQAAGRSYAARMIESAEKSIAKSQARIAELQKIMGQHSEAAFRIDSQEYTGWTRFFLVKHIHNTMACSSFRSTTRVGWLPKVSGLTEREAVSEYGETLCTICFPSAPVELTTKAADPSICTGSGKHYDSTLPNRTGYYSGNWATCTDCGERQTLLKGGKIRKHKNPNY
jgi:hypothetical protein